MSDRGVRGPWTLIIVVLIACAIGAFWRANNIPTFSITPQYQSLSDAASETETLSAIESSIASITIPDYSHAF